MHGWLVEKMAREGEGGDEARSGHAGIEQEEKECIVTINIVIQTVKNTTLLPNEQKEQNRHTHQDLTTHLVT